MKIFKKPDYAFIKPEKEFEGLKIYYLSKHLGLKPVDLDVNVYQQPDTKTLQKISSYFPINIKEMVLLNQIHSDKIVHKTNKKSSNPTADGIITSLKHIVLFIKTADCVPIFLYDHENKVIGAVHAGWRGTSLKIIKKAINKMEHFYKTKMENLYVFIGPAIGPCCYEVGKDVYESFSFLGKAKEDFFNRRKDKTFMMDLKGINAYLAEEEGVPQENIEICELCTYCNPNLFYSYRRDKNETGRNLNFIVMTK
jgi:YfiH family protein